MPEPNERQLALAGLLDQTAEGWNNVLTLLAEHLADVDLSILAAGRRITAQMTIAAERIRAGDYS
jgi:hypothetical protein